jgi:Zn-dependent peptidase ImmA (M78 family)
MSVSNFGSNSFDWFLTSASRPSAQSRRRDEVVRRLSDISARAGTASIPTDLTQVAADLGVVEVRVVPLANRGRLLYVPGGFVIEVNENLDHHERRFVVAHELAHIVLEGNSLSADGARRERVVLGHAVSYHALETLCDFAAAELLVPFAVLRDALSPLTVSLDAAIRLAAKADCAVELVAKRVHEANIWNCQFLWWRQDAGRFVAIKSIPNRDDDGLSRICLFGKSPSVIRAAALSDTVVTGDAIISYYGNVESYRCEAFRLSDNSVLSLLAFGH